MQTSVDRGQLRLLRVPRSGVPDVLLVERRDVLVPEARDRDVEDVLRQNVKRMRRRSARRLRIVHLPPRETHRMEPAGNGVPARGVRNPFRPVYRGANSGANRRSRTLVSAGGRPILKCRTAPPQSPRTHLPLGPGRSVSSTAPAPAISSSRRGP